MNEPKKFHLGELNMTYEKEKKIIRLENGVKQNRTG
jgi:hypothetical protein